MRRRVALALVLGVCVGSIITYSGLHKMYKEVVTGIREKHAQEVCSLSERVNSLSSIVVSKTARITELEDQLKETQKIKGKYSVGTFQVTAYSPYDNVSGMENNGNPNTTSTGVKPREGTIAVDPKVIPYGSNIIIIYNDGTVERGRAEDCGGLIKGNVIDVFRRTYSEAVQHGRRSATVIWY